MIYSFGAKNYFSFKDGFQVSLEFNSKVPKNISNSRKVSPILGIKGANASGKTHILKALKFISSFIVSSFKDDIDEEISIKGFFNSTKPTEFYIDFDTNGVRYTYELSVTTKEVIREALYKKISRKTPLLERKKNTITYRVAELESLDLITLKSNSSIIDTALQYSIKNISDDFKAIHSYFTQTRGNTSALGLVDDATIYDYKKVSEYYFKSPKSFELMKKIIFNSDLGIKDILIHKTKDSNGDTSYFPVFHHDNNITELDSNWLTYWEESDGTTALFRRMYQYWSTLESGGILLMDEFDTNYHPALLPQILDLFMNTETNPKNAQFLFTSHNLEIMDFLGKYRTYLVAKEDGESYCYRLDEIPGDIIRNDRPISGLYRDGKLGGVPKI
ncbi:AAA family ATPase [Pseudomonas rhodesiae]|uniref:AAA family ATPase n=1 Tax=Pseudomonas rhodesiae TaxID=76760 RepID=UPI0028A2A731|nr:ATP-binding protein [Pseudomonas rhodesiae]